MMAKCRSDGESEAEMSGVEGQEGRKREEERRDECLCLRMDQLVASLICAINTSISFRSIQSLLNVRLALT